MQKEPMAGSCLWCSFTLTAWMFGTFRHAPYRWSEEVDQQPQRPHIYFFLFYFFFNILKCDFSSLCRAWLLPSPSAILWLSTPAWASAATCVAPVCEHLWLCQSKIIYDDLRLNTVRFRAYWRTVHKWEPPIAEYVKWRINDAGDKAVLK